MWLTVFPLDSAAQDPSCSPLFSDRPVFSVLSMAQTGLKKFLEYVQLGTSDKVARLLDKGLDPNYHDSDSGGRERGWGLWERWGAKNEAQAVQVTGLSHPSETPLTLAAQTEGSVEVIRTLCLGGAHIDFRARDGMTALHKAACARHCLALTVRCQPPPQPLSQSPETPPMAVSPQAVPSELPRPALLPSCPPPPALWPPLCLRPGLLDVPSQAPRGGCASSPGSSSFSICSFLNPRSLVFVKSRPSSCPEYYAPFHRLTDTQPSLSHVRWDPRPFSGPQVHPPYS